MRFTRTTYVSFDIVDLTKSFTYSLLAHVDVHVQCRCIVANKWKQICWKYVFFLLVLFFFFFFNFEAFNWQLFRSFYTVIYLLRFNMYNIYNYLIIIQLLNHRTNIIVKTANIKTSRMSLSENSTAVKNRLVNLIKVNDLNLKFVLNV